MFSFRMNFKPLLGIILGIPFILLILHTRPGTPGEFYAAEYSDSAQSSNDNSSSPDLSISPSPPSLEANFEQPNNNAFPQQADVLANCACDKIKSQILSKSLESPSSSDFSSRSSFVPNKPLYNDQVILFLITPTYTRATQMADMTRLSQTLRLVPNVFWMVIEDSHNKSRVVNDLLLRSNIPFVHLLGPRPATHLDRRSGRGVSNRLKAFEWLRENYLGTAQRGVIYFADDDNAYDVRIFDEMRDTQVVSMFPVGLITALGLSTPIVNSKTGKIIGFHDPFIGRRKFAVDMAGFAVNLQFFLAQKKATMPYKVGYEEDYFLKSLGVQIWQLEPKAKNCTQVLVWHTKTRTADWPIMSKMKKVTKYNETNLPSLYESVIAT